MPGNTSAYGVTAIASCATQTTWRLNAQFRLQLVCRAFETYLLLHPSQQLSFEWAWNLLQTITHNDELFLAQCSDCRSAYVQDSYALDHKLCPSCEISRHRQRRQGSSSFSSE